MATISTFDDMKASVGPGHDDTVIMRAWQAAESYVGKRCVWDTEPDPEGGEPLAPADLVQAVTLLTARYIARRNSPDGFVGMGDLGPVRVPVSDRDVDRLIAPWRQVVIA